jgi:arginase
VAGLGADTGIVWMDAHPDLNTPGTTLSGMFEGMALAAATGLCWRGMAETHARLAPAKPGHCVLFGARDIDPPEADLIEAHRIGRADSGKAIVDRLAGCSSVYIHLDMDVHDALQFRANGFAVPGGPSAEEVGYALREVGDRIPVHAFALTGLEPNAVDGHRGTEIGIGHVLALADAVDART